MNSKTDSIPNALKPANRKPRSAPHVWERFWHLPLHDAFYIGRKQFARTGLFTAERLVFTEALDIVRGEGRTFVAPWRRVKTTRLVKSWSATRAETLLAEFAKRPENPGGHGGLTDQVRPQVAQPNSDNNITGPTS